MITEPHIEESTMEFIGKGGRVTFGHERGRHPLRLADGDVVLDPIGVGVEILECVSQAAERGARRWSIDEICAARASGAGPA
jgi:hypothetical protein